MWFTHPFAELESSQLYSNADSFSIGYMVKNVNQTNTKAEVEITDTKHKDMEFYCYLVCTQVDEMM